ncbi:MAG: sodium-dependent transporter [Halothermotrichaceae bacterium]
MKRENWTSKLGFIMAASGSAIGLGNIWRFPYITGTNGGAIFILIYLLIIFIIGYPLIISEMTIGRKTNKNPVGAFKTLAPESSWWLLGTLGILSGFIILSYYSVVAGWSMAYIFKTFAGSSAEINFSEVFSSYTAEIAEPIFWHGVFMLLTILVISAGIIKGIQKIVKILMPLLFIIIIILIIRALLLPGAGKGLLFYLKPDFSHITIQTFTDAISQSFFTLSLGMGAMITYGSYLSNADNINDSAAYVIFFDTLFAVLAGFAIFPSVFALGYNPSAGPGLTFITLPAVFAEMPLGNIFGSLFFVLIAIAALTSSISLLEVIVAYVVDERGWGRKKAAQIIGFIIFLAGIPTVLGYSQFSNFSFLGMDVLDTYDWFANSIFLPLGGLLTAIFTGYVWQAKNVSLEANKGQGFLKIGLWYGFLIKYIVPAAIFIILALNIWITFQ